MWLSRATSQQSFNGQLWLGTRVPTEGRREVARRWPGGCQEVVVVVVVVVVVLDLLDRLVVKSFLKPQTNVWLVDG